ncbi:MAG: hypothetical protein DCC56_02090 [Anaerolineae bacterium]|nr:MAG: hypothetical protein DCC56_02090 [Anaerolineae bacterium]WKZ44827.1 MAG: hypothetical protein QY302_03425 [Anaerolineales bacterium]
MHYDLCLPWYWEHDIDFVHFVEQACIENGLTFWQITPDNLFESLSALYKGEKTFNTLLDRSQGDDRFLPINNWAREYNKRRINPPELSAWSEDKATMHLELMTAGLHTPHTILLAPFLEQPVPPPLDLTPLGNQFVIKPSHGGGSEGVILGASSLDQILRARMEFSAQKYLVQATVAPRTIQGRPAWFRVFYAVGKTYPCWWHPLTHVFVTVTQGDEHKYELSQLHDITLQIASICRLDWFTTEIALTHDNFIVVDYVNDQIDTRVQSKAVDGAPDEVIRNVARQLMGLARKSTGG